MTSVVKKKEYMKSYYEKNKQRILDYQKKYNKKNIGHIKEYQKEYSKKEDVLKKKREYYQNNVKKEKEPGPHCHKELSKSYLQYHIFKIHGK